MFTNTNAYQSQLGAIYQGQMIYNRRPRYNLTGEELRTKILKRRATDVIETPDATIAVDENGDVVAAEPKTNWGPLAVAAALAFVALG